MQQVEGIYATSVATDHILVYTFEAEEHMRHVHQHTGMLRFDMTKRGDSRLQNEILPY